MSEEYNPKLHCCRYWFKDFCECIKENKKKSRDENVNGSLTFLEKNNIEYIDSQTANIVIINNQSDKAFLSLKRQQGLFKCRFEGSSKWYTFSKKALIDKFSNKMNYEQEQRG